jgi:hypothetical protein
LSPPSRPSGTSSPTHRTNSAPRSPENAPCFRSHSTTQTPQLPRGGTSPRRSSPPTPSRRQHPRRDDRGHHRVEERLRVPVSDQHRAGHPARRDRPPFPALPKAASPEHPRPRPQPIHCPGNRRCPRRRHRGTCAARWRTRSKHHLPASRAHRSSGGGTASPGATFGQCWASGGKHPTFFTTPHPGELS